ncbi:hypothetical protein BDN72DRAFT_858297 [Pluteus cervinus]|uniref:Uncharacterized protein n=1 Tax=Pluteus cervinus TaxID=181527 RepID=A0ACD3ASG2_9AGAR|nr:hypothetical protein BDN72DRAFT_858297 [Pluteus cervinus]
MTTTNKEVNDKRFVLGVVSSDTIDNVKARTQDKQVIPPLLHANLREDSHLQDHRFGVSSFVDPHFDANECRLDVTSSCSTSSTSCVDASCYNTILYWFGEYCPVPRGAENLHFEGLERSQQVLGYHTGRGANNRSTSMRASSCQRVVRDLREDFNRRSTFLINKHLSCESPTPSPCGAQNLPLSIKYLLIDSNSGYSPNTPQKNFKSPRRKHNSSVVCDAVDDGEMVRRGTSH